MSEVRQIAHNTFIQIIGRAIVITISLIGFGSITRYLGPDGFGLYSTIYGFLLVVGVITDLGLQMTTTKLLANPDHDETTILGNALGIRLSLAAMFIIIAPLIALLFPYPTTVKIGIAIATIGLGASSGITVLNSFFQKHLRMHLVVIAEIIAKLIFIGCIWLIIQKDIGLFGIIAATAFDTCIMLLLMLIFIRRQLPLRPLFSQYWWRIIWRETWPLALTISLNLIYFKGDIVVMSLYRNQTEVGLYGASYKILEVLINVVFMFLGLLLPLFAKAVTQKNNVQLSHYIQGGFNVIIGLTLPLLIGGYMTARPLALLVAGPNFILSGDIMKILLLATGCIFVASLFGYVVVALNQQRRMIGWYASNAILSVIGYLIFIPRYSYWGAAWMTVFTELFILIGTMHIVRNQLIKLPNLKIASRALLASLVMAGALTCVTSYHVVAQIVIGGVIYIGALYVLGGLDRQLLKEIMSIKKSPMLPITPTEI